MFCSISGNTPEHPVISTKSGHLFEKSLVEKLVDNSGKCPITGDPLTKEDLVAVQSNASIKPRPVNATSIPGMLTLFQNEWDSLMLETFTLKQHLETVRQELAHALYQHDAACRVIARLIKERDDARNALATAKPMEIPEPAAAPMEVEKKAAGLSDEVKAKFDATSKSLTKGRKKRQPAPTCATAEMLEGFTMASSTALPAPVSCMDMVEGSVLAGVDKNIVLVDSASKKVKTTLKGHTGKVCGVKLHTSKPVALSCSLDKTAKVWNLEDSSEIHSLTVHTAGIVGCALHATGEYAVTASADKTWALHDITQGTCLVHVSDAKVTAGFSCCGFHPDGLILGTGTEDSLIRIWDVKSQNNVASFKGHSGKVTALSFSENGYYLATSAEDSTVKLWDLRKLTNFHTLTLEDNNVNCLDFDFSGQYLAVGGADVRIFGTKQWNVIKTWGDHKKPVHGVKFGKDALKLCSVSMDKSLKTFAASA